MDDGCEGVMQDAEFDIAPASVAKREAVQARLDRLAKPPGSLGKLEELAVDLAGMQHREQPEISSGRVVIFAASHAVASNKSVSAYPTGVTAKVVEAFCSGSAAVNVLASQADLEVEVVTFGVEGLAQDQCAETSSVTLHRSGRSTPGAGDITERPAVRGDGAHRAFQEGIDAVDRAAEGGVDAICLGDVGIGNTTGAAAVTAGLLECEAREVTGPGTGLDADGVERKAEVVACALERADVSRDAPLEVLAQFGGPDFLGMAGVCLRAAERRIPVVLDGFIVGSAALGAFYKSPRVADYLIPATLSSEPGHRAILQEIDIGGPLLDWSLRLGEASAASLVVPLLRSACAIVREMATLDEIMSD